MGHEEQQNNKYAYHIRTMIIEDFPPVIEIFKECGWAVGEYHLDTLFKVVPNGWKVAVSNLEGEVLGVGVIVDIADKCMYGGYFAVKKECRKMGIGEKLWDVGMEISGRKNFGLNAFPDMFLKYQARGVMKHVDTDVIFTYKTNEPILIENLSSVTPEGVGVIPFEDPHLPAMLTYDESLGETSSIRQRFIELNSKEKGSRTFVAFKKGVCVGFGTMAITLLKIPRLAPLYADDVQTAEVILKQLLMSFPDHKGLFMSAFAANEAASDMMDKIKCSKSSESYHMYKHKGRVLKFKSSMHRLFAQLDLGMMEY